MGKSKEHRGGLPPDKYLSTDQVRRLLAHVKSEADKARSNNSLRGVVNEMIIELLLLSGLRANELCNLQMRDLPHYHGKGVLFVRDGKGNVSRTIEVPSMLEDKLNSFVKCYRKSAKPGTAVIPSEKGYRQIRWKVRRKSKVTGRMMIEEHSEYSSRMTYRSLYARIVTLGQKSGIGRLTPHMLRHTYLCLLYAVREDLRCVQDQAGHSNPATTAIYAKTSPESRRQQVEALESDVFSPLLSVSIGKRTVTETCLA